MTKKRKQSHVVRDLDQMEAVKSWPLSSWRLFLATLLPEVVLITILALDDIHGTSTSGFKVGHIIPLKKNKLYTEVTNL